VSSMAAKRGAAVVPRDRLDAYRDDGPLARALAVAVGGLVPIPAVALTVAAAVPLVVVIAITGARPGPGPLGAAVAWAILAGGVGGARRHARGFDWLVPPLLRALEYGTLLCFAAIAGLSAVPACFALVAVLTFHHYDIVYRLRHQGVAPPAWLSLGGGGWDGRIVIGYVLLLAGAVTAGFVVMAVALGGVYLAESTASWLRFSRSQWPAPYADEDEDDEDA
jgi:Family of unknown function (DUF5941)